MRKLTLYTGALLVAVGLMSSPVVALNVGFINNSGGSLDYLEPYGHTVSYLDNPIGLTFAEISVFEVVVITTNGDLTESEHIGDLLADFADIGGGVVLGEYGFHGSYAVEGRIMSAGYCPFTVYDSGSPYPDQPYDLGTVYDAGHPLFAGVNTSNVWSHLQGPVGLNTGAVLLADWASGRHAFAYSTLPNASIVGLNLFPGYAFHAADTRLLVSNALEYSIVGGGSPIPEPSIFALTGVGLGLLALLRKRRK